MENLYPWNLFGSILKLWGRPAPTAHYYGGETEVTTSTHFIAWDVKNLTTFCPQDCESFPKLWSPTFNLKLNDGKRVQSKISLEGSNKKLSCFLRLEMGTGLFFPDFSRVNASYTLALGNHQNPDILLIEEQSSPTIFYSEKGKSSFVSIQTLYKERSSLLNNGTLQIQAKITIFGEPSKRVRSYSVTKNDANGTTTSLHRTLSQNMLQLLNDPSHADVKIICEDKFFTAHKAILCSRSPVFRAMLESQMMESASGEIRLLDIDASSVQDLLTYLYSGEVPRPKGKGNSYLPLIHAAEKYELEELKHFCYQQLASNITLESIGEVAVGSKVYGAREDIREAIRKFSTRNLDGILKTPALKEIFQKDPRAFLD